MRFQALRVLPFSVLLATGCVTQGLGSDDGVPDAGAGGLSAGSGGAPGGATSGGSSGTATGGTGPGSGGSAGVVAGGVGGTVAGSSGAGFGGTAGANGGGAGQAGAGNGGGANGGGAGLGGSGGQSGSAGQGGSAGQSGSAGKAGSGGAGGAAGFNPCPATGPCKVLPLGDSITDGVGVSGGGGYRIELFRLAVVAGKELTFVGGSMNGPQMVEGQPFPRSHEGHSGWTISQIDGIVPSPALGPDPHIVLLHIGTNDLAQGQANGAPQRLGTLMDQITTDLPDSLLVVAKIIPLSSAVTAFNNAIPALVTERANAGKHVVMVDQNTGFPTSELPDGVHPNAAGYARMARVWYAAIEGYLR